MVKKGKAKKKAGTSAEDEADEVGEGDESLSRPQSPSKATPRKKAAAKKPLKKAAVAAEGEGEEEAPEMEEAVVRKKKAPKKKAKAKAKKAAAAGAEVAEGEEPTPRTPKKAAKKKAAKKKAAPKSSAASSQDVDAKHEETKEAAGEDGTESRRAEVAGGLSESEEEYSKEEYSNEEEEDEDELPWFGLEEERAFKCKDHRLVIATGDITEFCGDVLVNAANTLAIGGSGVDGIITEAGGPEMAKERYALHVLNRDTGERIPVGEARMTSAGGKLLCKNVIHTVSPKFRTASGKGKDAEMQNEQLRSAYLEPLKLATEMGADAICYPLLGTGNFQGERPLEEVLNIGWETLLGWCKTKESDATPIEIYFWCQSEAEMDLLQSVALSETRKPEKKKFGNILSKAKFW